MTPEHDATNEVRLWRAPNGTLHAFPVEGGVEGVWRPRADDDAVEEAAKALCDYLDKTSGGEEWKGSSLVRRLRAALAAPVSPPAKADRCPTCGSSQRNVYGGCRLHVVDGHYRADPWHTSPPAPRGEAVEPWGWGIERPADGLKWCSLYETKAEADAAIAGAPEGHYRVVALVPKEAP